jgi:23S rRNA pseudouridine955/2504/2580 synthase
MEKNNTFTVTENDANRRIDRIIRKMLPNEGLSRIYKYIREGKILVNNKKVKQGYKVNLNDKISLPEEFTPKPYNSISRKINQSKNRLEIIFENKNILVVNKPQELKTHGNKSLNALVSDYLFLKINHSLSFKPGPAHRLDTNTTGIVCFSKSLSGAQYLAYCFKNNCFNKYYLALTDGNISKRTVWKDFIKKENKKAVINNQNEANAVTAVYPVISNSNYSLIICRIDTGKYHQIRSQASWHGCPLAGDKKYAGSGRLKTYLLHAVKLSVKDYNKDIEGLNHQFKSIDAPIPENSEKIIKDFFGDKTVKLIRKTLGSI